MSARDQDYRGQQPPLDFARAVFDVQRGRPGALEVLQDALEMYFPEQFAEAKDEAEKLSKETAGPWLVAFNGRVARNRFRRWQDPRSTLSSPFRVYSERTIETHGVPQYTTIVWAGRPRRSSLRYPRVRWSEDEFGPLRVERGVTGDARWFIPGRTPSVYWRGPGSRLWLDVGGRVGLVRIDHPLANDTYETFAAADRAARLFLRA